MARGDETITHAPSRLSAVDTVYAMTVHKSQGAEFDQVLLILPDKDTPLLTRELLYTGVTRARKKVEVWSTDELLRSAIGRQIVRTSGLRDALQRPDVTSNPSQTQGRRTRLRLR